MPRHLYNEEEIFGSCSGVSFFYPEPGGSVFLKDIPEGTKELKRCCLNLFKKGSWSNTGIKEGRFTRFLERAGRISNTVWGVLKELLGLEEMC